jgi:pimeloyl-ACP methyl ester carboxylesterase
MVILAALSNGGPLLPDLAREHRVIAIDFLGYGESDAPDIAYAIPEQERAVIQVLDFLQLLHPDVVGFSMGGWVALKFAVDHPDIPVGFDSAGTLSSSRTAKNLSRDVLCQLRRLGRFSSDEGCLRQCWCDVAGARCRCFLSQCIERAATGSGQLE